MTNCQICSKPATKFLSPDLDIRGLGACDEHIETMRLAYMVLCTQGGDAYTDFISGCK